MSQPKRTGRIVVHPTSEMARDAGVAESDQACRCVVWPTVEQAIASMSGDGGNPNPEPASAPLMTELQPATAQRTKDTQIVVNGSFFVDGAVLLVKNQTVVPATFNNASQLAALVPGTLFNQGVGNLVPVQVKNPDDQVSNILNLTIV